MSGWPVEHKKPVKTGPNVQKQTSKRNQKNKAIHYCNSITKIYKSHVQPQICSSMHTTSYNHSFHCLILFDSSWPCTCSSGIARPPWYSQPLHPCLLISECVRNIHKHLWCSKGGQGMSSQAQAALHGAVWKRVVSVFKQHLLACPQRAGAQCSWSPTASRWNLSLNKAVPTMSRSWSEQMPENSLEHLPCWFTSSKRSYEMSASCQT